VTDQGNETPAADPRPRPQYGEYAPPGWVSPAADAPKAEPVELTPPLAPPVAPPPPLARRTPRWDRPLTLALLAVGLFGALIGWIVGSELTASLPAALESYGIEPGAMPAWLDTAGTALVASHLLLYLLAVGLSISLLRAGRPAFWAPLGAGVVAAIIFWSVLSAAVAPYVDQFQP
jgi:hypothetical protein